MFRQLETNVVETKFGTADLAADVSRTSSLDLTPDTHLINLVPGARISPINRTSIGIDAEEASRRMLSISRDGGARAGDAFSVRLEGDDFDLHRFSGALQKRFLLEIGALEDLRAALAFCVERGWLEIGQRAGVCGEIATYRLTQAGLEFHHDQRG